MRFFFVAGNHDLSNDLLDGLWRDKFGPTWKRVEALLADRPHTVFSGHIHHYVQYQRNGGRQYYALATTGGGSQLRGRPYGEFDHVTWLTMEHDGPQVVNLMLDGILPPDVVTEEESVRFRDFLARTVVEVAPIFLEDSAGFAEGDLHVRITNGCETPVSLEGEFDGLPLRGLTVDPERPTLEAAGGGAATASVRLRFGETIAFSRLAAATFRARLRTPARGWPHRRNSAGRTGSAARTAPTGPRSCSATRPAGRDRTTAASRLSPVTTPVAS